jgi:hypothetical protein
LPPCSFVATQRSAVNTVPRSPVLRSYVVAMSERDRRQRDSHRPSTGFRQEGCVASRDDPPIRRGSCDSNHIATGLC